MQEGELVCFLMVSTVPLDRSLCLALRQVSWRFLDLVDQHHIINTDHSATKLTGCEHDFNEDNDEEVYQRLLSGGEFYHINALLVKSCLQCYATDKRFLCVFNTPRYFPSYNYTTNEYDYCLGVANNEGIPYVELDDDCAIVFMRKHLRGYDMFDTKTKPKRKRRRKN